MDLIAKTIAATVSDLFSQQIKVKIERPDPKFGDAATNVALLLSKSLKKSPREIADTLAVALESSPLFASVAVAGPGFINLTLTDSELLKLVRDEPQKLRAGQEIVIETNNPNPFKAMHIGHAYNAILADTMANLLAVSGARVHRVSYHGDVGTHVGRSMWAILRETEGDAAKLVAIDPDARNQFMNKMYAEGSRAANESETVKKEVDALAKQSFLLDDPTYTSLYTTCLAWSYEAINAVVARLGNVPIEKRYVESQTEAPGKKLVIEHTPAVFTQSDGAYVFEGSKYGSFDNVYIGSHGNGLYGAHDMGLIWLKYQDYPALDESIVVTGNEQGPYFKGVIAASELVIPELTGKLKNYPTGIVKLTTGKMSSRTGEVIEVDWLFEQFGQAIVARGGEPQDDVIAGALRYQFLKTKIGNDVVFDINEAVSLTGNTGSYLQYAHARAVSILKKSSAAKIPQEVNPEDRDMVRKLGEYTEVVTQALTTLEPHHLCNYLFSLAQEFNRYYEKNQVIGSDEEVHRVGIVALYADTLKAGLKILGISAPEKI